MGNKYLTPELIEHVQKKAEDPIWKMGIEISSFTNAWYEIMKVSYQTGLIHISGNSETGWQHILDRHNIGSCENYFGNISNPTKFSRKVTPIKDFVNIADDVYLNGTVDTKEHEESARFIKISGLSTLYSGSTGEPKKFHLILYRNTKIVHSLFPDKSIDGKIKPRKIRELARVKDKIEIQHRIVSPEYIAKVPYENEDKIIFFEIIFRINPKIDDIYIHLQVNDNGGNPKITTIDCWTLNFPLPGFAESFKKNDEKIRGLYHWIETENFDMIEKEMVRFNELRN